jgi:hypothetical protein
VLGRTANPAANVWPSGASTTGSTTFFVSASRL